MFCEKCGGKVSATANFCSSCGVGLMPIANSENIDYPTIDSKDEPRFDLGNSEIESGNKNGFSDPNFRKIFIAISATIVIILSLMVVVDLNTMEPGSIPEGNYSQEELITNSGEQSTNDSNSYSSSDYFNLGSREAEAGVKNRSTSQALIDSFGSNRAYCEGIAQIYSGSPADAMEAYISGCTDYLNNNPHYVP